MKGQRAIEGTQGRRGDIGPWRGQRAIEGTEYREEQRWERRLFSNRGP